MAELPSPLSRQESQRKTREALIGAARAVFAQDGYHGANLELIAREAGFSKGAVYSNFDGKASLFLAVMDANMEAALAEGGWDVFEEPAEPDTGRFGSEEVVAAIKGFALATLEFIATAGRDEELAVELGKRMQGLIDAYEALAQESRPDDEELSANEVGALLTALDQGAALLTLSGSAAIDQRLLRVGMQRLLDPGRPATSEDGDTAGESAGRPALHDSVIQQRIVSAMKDRGSSEE
ncbi:MULTISPECIES: TetR/AcrR family transcriptional regulator [unclassified Diaminobutyricimonas]|uniref:TetR/AcrR family transcriptional regulator n=1 Tax=unclassified Diaminobutyricimonas TaxID=2643261 RepID=UPI0012F4FBAB|nr:MULTISPECIES: TetR/AcrR family transcriptional regulator [unclassified Diaminobutyricimonas]